MVCLQAALNRLFSTRRHLDHVDLALRNIGAADAPVRMPALTSAKNLHLIGVEGCHIALDHDVPVQWRNFIIMSPEVVTLDLQDKLRSVRDLENFYIGCKSLPGLPCVQLTQKMGSLGRKVYCAATRRGHQRLTSFEKAGWSRFDKVMQCGCQACLRCLHQNRKLPEGSRVPKGSP